MITAAADPHHYWNGRLLVWEKPDSRALYCLGVDVAQGRGKDRSVIQVLRKGDTKRPDMQVAEYACDALGPRAFADAVAALGRYYHGEDEEALLVVERNTAGGGDLTLEDLRFRHNYSHLYAQKNLDSSSGIWAATLGWFTGGTSRPKLILALRDAITEGYIQVNSPLTLQEMETFEADTDLAKARARAGECDDRVIALALAYWGAHESDWLAGEDAHRVRTFDTPLTVAETSTDTTNSGPRKDFQNTAATTADYIEYAERWSPH